jgi:hypothetical protein
MKLLHGSLCRGRHVIREIVFCNCIIFVEWFNCTLANEVQLSVPYTWWLCQFACLGMRLASRVAIACAKRTTHLCASEALRHRATPAFASGQQQEFKTVSFIKSCQWADDRLSSVHGCPGCVALCVCAILCFLDISWIWGRAAALRL